MKFKFLIVTIYFNCSSHFMSTANRSSANFPLLKVRRSGCCRLRRSYRRRRRSCLNCYVIAYLLLEHTCVISLLEQQLLLTHFNGCLNNIDGYICRRCELLDGVSFQIHLRQLFVVECLHRYRLISCLCKISIMERCH